MIVHTRTRRASFLLLLLFTTLAAAERADAQGSSVLISEFRYNGPNGALDEFVEIYNNTDAPVTVGPSGWAVVSSDAPAAPKFVVPAGTVIPRRGHFLGVNAAGYSLIGYPAGNGTTATGDAVYTADIPINVGIALFNTSDPSGFTLANRLDAAGTTAVADPLFREGAGIPPITAQFVDYSFTRHIQSACLNIPNDCGTNRIPLIGSTPHDSNDNAVDFIYVATSPPFVGGVQRLGAPGPENLSSPVLPAGGGIGSSLIDNTVPSSSPPNRVSDLTPVPNGSLGTMFIRRRMTNLTGAPVTRLRFRIIDTTTFRAAQGTADVRALTSLATTATSNDPGVCAPAPAPCTVAIQGTTLEEPPFQENGGGWNATLSVGTVGLAQPLAPGQSVNLQFAIGVEQNGYFRFFVIQEALP